jgi:hypothetical protein
VLRNRLVKLLSWAAITVILVAFTDVVKPAKGAINPNLVVNPEAEMELSGWTSLGFAVAPYGSSPSVPATPLGQDMFVAKFGGRR